MGVVGAVAGKAGGIISVWTVAALAETESSAAMGVAPAGAWEAGAVVSVGAVAVLVGT